MKNIKLFYSLDKADPLSLYMLKLALRKAKVAYENLQWHNAPQEETKVVSHLLLTYQNQLIAQGKTIQDLGTPVLTWTTEDGSLDIRVGFEDITGAI